MNRILSRAFVMLSRPERLRLARITGLQIFVALCDIGSLALLLALAQAYTAPEPGGRLVGIILQLRAVNELLAPALLLLLFALKNGLAFATARQQYRFIYGVATRLSGDRLQQYLNGDFSGFTDLNPAAHISRISYQPTEFATNVLGAMQQLSAELVLTGLAVLALLLFKARLFICLMAILTPPLLLAAAYSRRRLQHARGRISAAAERNTQDLQEALAGYVESNLYQRNGFFVQRYSRSHAGLAGMLAALQISQALPARILELFAVAGLMTLITLSLPGVPGAVLDPLTIGAFLAAAYKIIPGITRISNALGQLRSYGHTTEPPLSQCAEQQELTEALERIRFEQVGFSFGDGASIRGLSFELRRGEIAGLSAASGRGKTTALNLLLGFLEPQAGAIRINGRVANARERRGLWPQTAYVRQQAFFIDGSLLQNITLDDTAPDPVRLRLALRLSGLNDLVQSSPGGLERRVADNGKQLSGGQRQRLAFARAIYKNAPLLILDEPFSELDPLSERQLLSGLAELAGLGSAILLVSHNQAGLNACHKLIRLED